MRFSILVAIGISVLLLACGTGQPHPARRTLSGVSQHQVLIAAQHTLASEGMDVQEMDFQKGTLISTWQKKHRRQVQYQITVSPPGTSKHDGGTPQGVTDDNIYVIAVSAKSKERLIKGWSEPAQSSLNTDDLLDDIIATAIDRYDPSMAESLPRPVCKESANCPLGTHWVSGHCVAECTADSPCETGSECDSAGRCVRANPALRPPPPAVQEPPAEDVPTDTDEEVQQ